VKPADILVDNPVLNREFRGRTRIRKLSGKAWRVVAVIVVLIALRYYYILLRAVQQGRPDDAVELWRDTSYLLLTLIALLSPAMAATAISQELEQQTWDLLKVTRLTAWQVVIGKWMARQTIPAIVVLIATPLLLMCALHGKLGFVGFAANLGYLALTSAFFSAMGLWCSAAARKTAAATAVSLLLMGVVCLGTCLIDGIISLLEQYRRDHGLGTHAMWINPFYVISMMDDVIRDPSIYLARLHFAVAETSVSFELAMVILFLYLLAQRYQATAAS